MPDSRPGRKPIPTRAVLEAVLWILNTGAQWHFLPQCYPNYKTVHRRFQQWCHHEVLRKVLTQLANTLRDEGTLDERESFIDATFAAAKGGGEAVGLTKHGKGRKEEKRSRVFDGLSRCVPTLAALNVRPATSSWQNQAARSTHQTMTRPVSSTLGVRTQDLFIQSVLEFNVHVAFLVKDKSRAKLLAHRFDGTVLTGDVEGIPGSMLARAWSGHGRCS